MSCPRGRKRGGELHMENLVVAHAIAVAGFRSHDRLERAKFPGIDLSSCHRIAVAVETACL